MGGSGEIKRAVSEPAGLPRALLTTITQDDSPVSLIWIGIFIFSVTRKVSLIEPKVSKSVRLQCLQSTGCAEIYSHYSSIKAACNPLEEFSLIPCCIHST